MPAPIEIIRRYFDAIEAGDTAAAMSVFDPGVVQLEYPNGLKPGGDRRTLEALARDAERGRALLASQRYEILDAITEGDRIAARVSWRGVLAVPLGGMAAGDTLRVESAMFFRLRDGRIVEQHNYDSLTPESVAANERT